MLHAAQEIKLEGYFVCADSGSCAQMPSVPECFTVVRHLSPAEVRRASLSIHHRAVRPSGAAAHCARSLPGPYLSFDLYPDFTQNHMFSPVGRAAHERTLRDSVNLSG
jgi:hypothetical protein